MAGNLTRKKRAELLRDLQGLREHRYTPGDDVASWYSRGKSLRLDINGYRRLQHAAELLQSVPEWNAAYPFETLTTRIVQSLFDADTIEDSAASLLRKLTENCKSFVAYAPMFGFNLTNGATLAFGDYKLQALGEQRVESEIIGRLRQHTAGLSEPLLSQEIARFRKATSTLHNVPALTVPFYGSSDGAVKVVSPIAERVAAFVQFAIGMLTDQNTHIIDHRGRFTGEFSATMPVMTIDFDELDFPDVRGFPYRSAISPDDIEKLDGLGILSLGEAYVKGPWGSRNSISSLINRAISCFSDGERGVTNTAKITSYVSVVEIFFARKDCIDESFATGLAAATSTDREPFRSTYEMAKAIYEERSCAVHNGVEPTLTWLARRKAKEVLLCMIAKRNQLSTRKMIRAWVQKQLDEIGDHQVTSPAIASFAAQDDDANTTTVPSEPQQGVS